MNEVFIQFLWSEKVMGHNLQSTDGEAIEIVKPGRWNTDNGPDFLDAKVRIGDTLWNGHVEVHIKSKDWYAHGHDEDHYYDPTILHVVWEKNEDTLNIPCLELKDIIPPSLVQKYKVLHSQNSELPCANFSVQIPKIKWTAWIDSLIAERMMRRLTDYLEILDSNKYDWPELLYIKTARALGQKKNGSAMESLAKAVPQKILGKHKNNLDELEALLYGAAGLLTTEAEDDYHQKLQENAKHLLHKYNIQSIAKGNWKTSGMRPANFPTIRIAQLAALSHEKEHLFSVLLEIEELKEAEKLFDIKASSYWDTRYSFGASPSEKSTEKKLGKSAIRNIFINTIIPILWAYGRNIDDPKLQQRMMHWLMQIPKEKNGILAELESLGIENKSALQSQALLQLNDEYCAQKNCLRCLRGREILKNA